MGARRVQVLDGGLPKWRAEGRPVESGAPPSPVPATFHARLGPDAVADVDGVRSALSGQAQVIDARSADRFLDMCRTTLNVTGDLVAATVVSRGESDDVIPAGLEEPVAPPA